MEGVALARGLRKRQPEACALDRLAHGCRGVLPVVREEGDLEWRSLCCKYCEKQFEMRLQIFYC